jgi:hypothetical protein
LGHPIPQPNYTLASRVEGKSKSKGQPVSVRGFWGDIVCGPFAAFAVEADEPRLFEARGAVVVVVGSGRRMGGQ